MGRDLQEWFGKQFAEFPRSSHEFLVINLENGRHAVQKLVAKRRCAGPPRTTAFLSNPHGDIALKWK
jgi:hypothetical protein